MSAPVRAALAPLGERCRRHNVEPTNRIEVAEFAGVEGPLMPLEHDRTHGRVERQPVRMWFPEWAIGEFVRHRRANAAVSPNTTAPHTRLSAIATPRGNHVMATT